MNSSSQALALLGLRSVVGAVILAHGINHIFGGGKVRGTARWFESMGMKPGLLHAWTASLTEVGSGLLLLMGLLTPLASAGVVGVMLVAWMVHHRKNGFFIFRPGEGWEYVMLLCSCALVVALVVPGPWSADDVLGLHLSGWTGLVIAGGAGAGGAAALMATFWRPQSRCG
jgi:putative oxidoreductase